MTDNPYLRRESKSVPGRNAEKKTAKKLGARLTPNSGAMDGAKGDMSMVGSDYEFLLENKSTVKDSFSIKRDHLCKVSKEARAIGKVAGLSFQFTTGDGTPRPGESWVAIPEHVFKEVFS